MAPRTTAAEEARLSLVAAMSEFRAVVDGLEKRTTQSEHNRHRIEDLDERLRRLEKMVFIGNGQPTLQARVQNVEGAQLALQAGQRDLRTLFDTRGEVVARFILLEQSFKEYRERVDKATSNIRANVAIGISVIGAVVGIVKLFV